ISVTAVALAFAIFMAISGRAQNAQQPADAPVQTAPPGNLATRPLQPGQPGTIRSTVDLVQVDVTVNGRDGKVVKGLKQDQFTISEDGHEQRIASFDYFDVEKIETASAGADAAPLVIALGGTVAPEVVREQVRDHRLMVMFFDLSSLQPPDLDRS